MGFKTAMVISAAGLVCATAYGTALGVIHQSAGPDKEVMIGTGLLMGLVLGPICLTPSWLSFRMLAGKPVKMRRLTWFLIGIVVPTGLLCWWTILQWRDWDELATLWIGLPPTLISSFLLLARE